MRKIEQKLIAAIRAAKSASFGNTAVTQTEHGAIVTLHGNVIARIGTPDGTHWTLAGWNTNTTRSRIRALAFAFNWARTPHTVRGIPHASGTPISSTQWVNAFNAAHVSAF
jgi:hypothetical protein